MDDISKELAKLHVLTGADFSRQVERIAKMNVFRPLEGESNVFITGGEQDGDFENLLSAAHKAVEHGYRVFILPNPKRVRSADFIFERKRIYRLYDLKTVTGKGSVDNRLSESIGQSNRVVLNINTDYKAGKLARSIKAYFERYDEGLEIIVFKSNKIISVTRQMVRDKNFIITFSKKYYK